MVKIALLSVALLSLNLSAAWAQSATLAGAAILPSSRAVQVNQTATVFATLLTSGPNTALGCTIAPTNAPAGTAFTYQRTNAQNVPIGTPNTPVDIPGGQGQSFVLSLRPSQAFAATDIRFAYDCTNTDPVAAIPGVNTLLLTSASGFTPDVIALVATLHNDGIVRIPGTTGTGIFSVATLNLGAGGLITAAVDTGGTAIPVTVTLCRTVPLSGDCFNPPTSTVTVDFLSGGALTFGIFVQGTGMVSFDPALHRLFLRFTTQAGGIVGSTSVAVNTVAQIPDVRGTYVGSGSLTQTACPNAAFNGTFGFSANVALLSQTGTTFTGTATLTASIAGSNFVVHAGSLTGTVNANGQISGPFLFQTFADGAPFGSGTGTYSGTVTGNTLALQFSGQAVGGGTVAGSLAATR